jgi:Zn-dependent protease with chaperone function
MAAGDRRGDRWFLATVAAAALPVAVAGTIVGAWSWMPGANHLFSACAHWVATPAGRWAARVLGALLAYPLIRGGVSAARRIAGTRRWLHLLRYTTIAPWPGAYRTCVVQAGLEGQVELCGLPPAGAWTVGLRHPRIVVTTSLLRALSPEEFAAVLHHEAYHLRARHPLKALVVGVLLDGFGWFPAVSASARAYAAARELDADAAAARRCGREALRSALMKCQGRAATTAPFGAPAFTDLARLRLERLAGSEGTAALSTPVWAWLQSAILALCCSALGVAACGAAPR